MIEFQMLGTLKLRAEDGRELDSLLAQPKRLALLAYLCAARPAGFHRRDSLLALFWPDADSARARTSLRGAVHVLRRILGEAAILSRGDEEIGANFELLRCDVVDFAGALARGRPVHALESYRGDFLDGFCIDDVPDFERWLSAERAHLRASAARAAALATELYEREQDIPAAVEYARRAVSLAPDDEGTFRRLVALLDRTGDRSGALREYAEFSRRLGSEYDVEPSPETQRLVATIRSRPTSSLEPAITVAPSRVIISSSGTSTELERTTSVARHPRRPLRRLSRATLLVVGLTAATTLALIASLLVPLADGRGRGALDPNLIVVAPFAVVAPNDSIWREGLADWFVRALDGAGPLRTVSTAVALRRWNGQNDRSSAMALARRTGAALALFGTVVPTGKDSSRIRTTLINGGSGAMIAEHEAIGATDRMDRLADTITVALLQDLAPGRGSSGFSSRGFGSQSLLAIKGFLRGEQAFRRAQWDSAEVAYEAAASADSEFALPIHRLGRLAAWRQMQIGVGRLDTDSLMLDRVRRASPFANRLGLRDSLLLVFDSLLAAFSHDEFGNAMLRPRMLAMTRLLVSRFPRDAAAWSARGDALYLSGGYMGHYDDRISKLDMLQAYDSAITLDPGYALAYDRAFRLAFDVEDFDKVRRYARDYLRLNPPPPTAAYLRLIVRLLDSPREVPASLDTIPADVVWEAWASLLLQVDSAEIGHALAERLRSTTATGGLWNSFQGTPTARFRHRPLGGTLAFRGHLREAYALTGTEHLEFFPGLFSELALLGAIPPATADSTLHDWLRTTPIEPLPSLAWGLAWLGERGDTTSLLRFINHAQPLTPEQDIAAAASERGHYRHFREVAEAYLALARRDSSSALRLLLSLPSEEFWTYERIVAARLLVALGKNREALALLERDCPYPFATPLRGLWAYERGRIAEQLGEKARARTSYNYVVRLWRNADPQLQGYVQSARAGLSRIQ